MENAIWIIKTFLVATMNLLDFHAYEMYGASKESVWGI